MFDDFFIRALVAGLGVAIVTGPLGCFVIWRRLSYFGDTLSHSALLGVTLAYSMELNIALSVFIISSLIALTLIHLQKRTNLPGDALLGLLAHSSLAVGLVVIGFLTFIRFDIMGLLFGDILAVTVKDIFVIWVGGALIAGIGVALVTGPLGCFVVWRRLSYFGDTLSHSALLGVTMAYSFELNIALSVFIISSAIALILIQLQKKTNLPGDAFLGLLAHSSLAVGLVVIGFLTFIRFDIMGLLFGDILAVTTTDIFIIWTGGAIILLVLKFIWKPLFASTVNYELAEAEGLNPDRAKAIFTILMAAVIAISIKMVGLLLITGMLIIPAAMARNISNSPQKMVLFSVIGCLLSVILGLFSSLEFNTSSGPSIIVAALFLFILSLLNIKQSIKLKN